MKGLLLSVVISILVSSCAPKSTLVNLDKASNFFKDIDSLCKLDNGKLWGVNLYGPILIVDNETRAVIANMPDNENQLKRNHGVYVGELPQEISIANTTVEWLGHNWAMVNMNAISSVSEYARYRLLIHESWHREQRKFGVEFITSSNQHLDESQGEVLLKLELIALRNALVNSTTISQDLTNALLFRLHRQSLYPNNNEDAFERLEGLAEYTGFKLAANDSCLKTNELIKHIDTGIEKIGFSNSFAYFTGPAYGFIFDRYFPNWTEQVKQGLSLTQIGCKLVNITPSYIDTVKIEFIVKQYKADSLINAVKSRAEKEKQLVENLENKFFKNSRLVIPNNNVNFTFNPQEKLVSMGEGVVYPTFSLTAKWGNLKVSEGIYRENNWRFFIVPLPDSIISGVGENKYIWDGYELMLKSGYFIQEIEDRKFQIAKKQNYSN